MARRSDLGDPSGAADSRRCVVPVYLWMAARRRPALALPRTGSRRRCHPASCDNPCVTSWDDRLYEFLIHSLVTRVPGRGLAVIVALLYGGLGLALPVLLGWTVPWLIAANIVGVSFAFAITSGWIALQIQSRDRRHLVEWTTDLRRLSAEEFEWLVGELFRREGWTIDETGHQDRADGNIDLKLEKRGERRIVQCKRWGARLVGVDEIRGFSGTLLREGLPGKAGVFVTLSAFTEYARAEAQEVGLELIDNQDLYARIERVRRPEPCPICDQPMRLDRSARGWWFRCVASGCLGKRDLSREPERAVELLTQQSVELPRRDA